MRNRFNIFHFAVLILSLILAYDAFAAPIAMPESQRTPIPTPRCNSELTGHIQMSGTFANAKNQLKLQFPNETILGVFWNSNDEVLIVTRDYAPEGYVGLQTPTSSVRERVTFRLGRTIDQKLFEKLEQSLSNAVQAEANKSVSHSLASNVMSPLSRSGIALQYGGGQKAGLLKLQSSSADAGVLTLAYSHIGMMSDETIEFVVRTFIGAR